MCHHYLPPSPGSPGDFALCDGRLWRYPDSRLSSTCDRVTAFLGVLQVFCRIKRPRPSLLATQEEREMFLKMCVISCFIRTRMALMNLFFCCLSRLAPPLRQALSVLTWPRDEGVRRVPLQHRTGISLIHHTCPLTCSLLTPSKTEDSTGMYNVLATAIHTDRSVRGNLWKMLKGMDLGCTIYHLVTSATVMTFANSESAIWKWTRVFYCVLWALGCQRTEI